MDALQESWIAEHINGRSCVEENPVRVYGTLQEECVMMDEY